MRSQDDEPKGWEAVLSVVDSLKDGSHYEKWGDLGDDFEVMVSAHGTVVLRKGWQRKGPNLELPWIEMTAAELRTLVSRGEELLRVIEAAKSG